VRPLSVPAGPQVTQASLDGSARRTGRELAAVLITLTALLVVLIAAGLWISSDLNRGAQRAYVREALPTRSAVVDLALQMVNQETGTRGYIVTRRQASLEPYVAGRRMAHADLALLGRLAADQPRLARLLVDARGQIAELEIFFDAEIALVRSGPAGAARARRDVEQGTALFDRFRRTSAAMARATDRLVTDTERDQHARYRALVLVLALVGAAAVAVAVALAVIVPRRAARLIDERARRFAEERDARETLDHVLALTPRFYGVGSPGEARRRICEAAIEAFGCAAASLWEIDGATMRLAERVPWPAAYQGADERAIAETPGLAAALAHAHPLFVHDVAGETTGATQRTAQALGTGSQLMVPIAVGGVAQHVLILLWGQRIAPPAAAQAAAAQRFADQAGLAIEQARRRSAQAEIESLNRTLQQMVDTDPLFRAGGTPTEVGEAICAAALRIFGASGAALWTRHGDNEIELLHRAPAARLLPVGTRLALTRFASFNEALTGGRPRFVADVERDEPDLWESFAKFTASRSQLRLPLASAGGARSLIILSWRSRLEPPTRQERAVAARFADQAALAVAEATRREALRDADEMHATFERGLLPRIDVATGGVRVATVYRPGDERLSLGGDFYDCLEIGGGRLAVLVGDVTGHGPAAAAIGAALRNAWRALILAGTAPHDTLPALQRVLQRQLETPEMFVTAISATIDVGAPSVTLASAGHPAPLVVGAGPSVVVDPGPPLGVEPDAAWPVAVAPLARPSSLVFYTDGLIEGRAAPDSVQRLGAERLCDILRLSPPGGVDEAELQRTVAAVSEANGAGLPDDVAAMAINLTAETSAPPRGE
jgi:serine phosphatase RsbU (regulator of sigma subunit)/CHASE3 domain sensor protein